MKSVEGVGGWASDFAVSVTMLLVFSGALRSRQGQRSRLQVKDWGVQNLLGVAAELMIQP